jgi:deazaflavin-dependent oxidoreductase (nitroreductase family)
MTHRAQAEGATVNMPDNLAQKRHCYLTTTGRVSGKPHEIEMSFAATGDTVYMLSGAQGRSDWVKNLRRNPEVRIRVGTTTWTGTARVIESGDPQEQQARELVAAKYQGWEPGDAFSQWARESLPVAVDLGASDA